MGHLTAVATCKYLYTCIVTTTTGTCALVPQVHGNMYMYSTITGTCTLVPQAHMYNNTGTWWHVHVHVHVQYHYQY